MQGQNKFQSNSKISRAAYHLDKIYIKKTGSQKHVGLILDTRLNFEEHLKTVFTKVTKTIGPIPQLRDSLARPSLLAFYKCFVRTHFDYGNTMYDNSYKNSFQNKTESIQYNAGFAIK